MITDIRYVAVMVENLEEGVKVWQNLLGLEPLNEPSVNQYGIRAQMLGYQGRPVVEVMEPASPESALARLMEERKVRRLVILDRAAKVVGMVSLDDLAARVGDEELAGEVLKGLTE